MHCATQSLKALGIVTILGLAVTASPAFAQKGGRPLTLVTVTRSLDVAAIRLSDDIAEQGDQVRHFQAAAQAFTDAAEHLRLMVLQKVPTPHLMNEYRTVRHLFLELEDELHEHGSTPMIDRDMRIVQGLLRQLSFFFQTPNNGHGHGHNHGNGKQDGHDGHDDHDGDDHDGDDHDGHDGHDDHDGKGKGQGNGQNKGNGQGNGQGNKQGPGPQQGAIGVQLGKVKIFIKKP